MGLKSILGSLEDAAFIISDVIHSPCCLSTRAMTSRFILLPNMNQVDSTLRPPDSTSMSAPAACSAWAVTIPSSAVAPRRVPSATLILASTAMSLPTARFTAANTRAGKRTRFSALPPYSSVRRLLRGEMNWLSR